MSIKLWNDAWDDYLRRAWAAGHGKGKIALHLNTIQSDVVISVAVVEGRRRVLKLPNRPENHKVVFGVKRPGKDWNTRHKNKES